MADNPNTEERGGNMTAGEEALLQAVTELKLEFRTYAAENLSCRNQCDKLAVTVFGNGKPGLAARVWVLWGLFTACGGAIIAIIKGWIGNQ